MIRGLLLISTCMVAGAAVVPRAVVAVQTPRGDAGAPRIAVGVLRADGILLPFAAYDGKKWSAPWGGRVERGVSQALPVNLAAIPDDWWGGAAPASWNLWPTATEKPQPLKLVSPAMVGIGTSRLL